MRRLVLLGLILLLLAIVGAWLFTRPTHPTGAPAGSPPALPQSPTALHQAWVSAVSSTLATYDRDGNATAARDALLALRVSADDRMLDLALVLAFQAVIDGRSGANTQLSQARAAFVRAST